MTLRRERYKGSEVLRVAPPPLSLPARSRPGECLRRRRVRRGRKARVLCSLQPRATVRDSHSPGAPRRRGRERQSSSTCLGRRGRARGGAGSPLSRSRGCVSRGAARPHPPCRRRAAGRPASPRTTTIFHPTTWRRGAQRPVWGTCCPQAPLCPAAEPVSLREGEQASWRCPTCPALAETPGRGT